MHTYTNQNIVFTLIKAGLLISILIADSVCAAECTSLKLIVNRSLGVTESNNECKEESKISIGTTLKVSAGSRLWLKSDADENGITSQVICQNRSGDAVNVTIDSASLPWIKIQGLDNCGEWKSKRLNCADKDVQKDNFFCASATSKPLLIASVPMRKNSITMRGGLGARIAAEIYEEIKPEVKLCKYLYEVTSDLKVVWVVSKLGKVKDVNSNKKDTELLACIKSVLMPKIYKESSKEITYTKVF